MRWLQALDRFPLKGRNLRCDLIKIWRVFHSGGGDMLSPSNDNVSGATRGHNFKLITPHCHCHTDITKHNFHVRSINVWNGSPNEVFEPPFVIVEA